MNKIRWHGSMQRLALQGKRLWASVIHRKEQQRSAVLNLETFTPNRAIPKLISVHFPKAAGSSLIMVYESAFGPNRVLKDDNNDPMDPCGAIYLDPVRYEKARPTSLGDYAVVHGHFHVGLYDQITDALRAVILREPVNNIVSMYYYWKEISRRADPRYEGHCLYQYFCKTRPTLLEFAQIPAIRYLMSNVYFRNVDMACFDVIGDFGDIAGYVNRLATTLGTELGPIPRVNVTAASDERRAASQDHRILAQLRDLLADDLRFYERHCQ